MKKNYLFLFLILLVGISIGYAVINTTLNINGKSSISKNTWDIHFDNVKIVDGSVDADKVPTIDNDTKIDFEVKLNLPGDFYEFTVDVVNNGTIDAMIQDVVKEPELNENQKKYLNYIIEYENGETINTKQLVKTGEFVKLKVRVELRKDIAASELPEVVENLYLGFTLNYVQASNDAVSVIDNGVKLFGVDGDINEIGTVVTIGGEQFFVYGTEGNNVKLLSKYNLYVGGWNTGATASYVKYSDDEITGLQDPKMIGCDLNLSEFHGTIAFSTSNYWGNVENETYVYNSNSSLYPYVENYKFYLEGFGVTIEEARLIKSQELAELGCDFSKTTCSGAPSWVTLTTYWTGSANTLYTAGQLYVIYNSQRIFNNSYDFQLRMGLRPVIVISKDYFI